MKKIYTGLKTGRPSRIRADDETTKKEVTKDTDGKVELPQRLTGITFDPGVAGQPLRYTSTIS